MNESNGTKLAILTPKIMSAFHSMGKNHPSGEGLSMRQFQALILVHTEKELSLGQICTKLNVAPSTGTELVNRMIEADFFIKNEGSDRRQALISVTPKGEEVMRKRQKMLSMMFDKFLERFSQEDQQVFMESFEKIGQLVEKVRQTE